MNLAKMNVVLLVAAVALAVPTALQLRSDAETFVDMGSIPLLFGMSLVYLLSTLGLGLFVSSISNNQQQAMLTTTFFFMMPMIYLSGFVFPIENMPAWIQPFTYLIPLRYFLVIVRGIFLQGVGLEVLWPQALALLAWGVTVLGLATLRSSKRLG